jgi:hypothetical protein
MPIIIVYPPGNRRPPHTPLAQVTMAEEHLELYYQPTCAYRRLDMLDYWGGKWGRQQQFEYCDPRLFDAVLERVKLEVQQWEASQVET